LKCVRSRLRGAQNLAGHDAQNQRSRNGKQKRSSNGDSDLRRWQRRAGCCRRAA
jgi:hypothetical protein